LTLRDAVEECLRRWSAYEESEGNSAVITYDFVPKNSINIVPADRISTLYRLNELHEAAIKSGELDLATTIAAHVSFLRATLGERMPLGEYISVTQGCSATGWSAEYVDEREELAKRSLERIGVPWGNSTQDELEELEGLLDVPEVPQYILREADQYEARVRLLGGTDAPYRINIENTSLSVYWSYWLDGRGGDARLRFNDKRIRMTRVRARQFALHEVLGHALQCATWADRCSREEVPWVRLLSVHGRTHVAFEGLAQALPFLLELDDIALEARVRLDYYLQMVRSELHLMINSGRSVESCIAHARRRVPFWPNDMIAETLADRGVDPRLRSYLWTYPAGVDWFKALHETGDSQLVARVVQATFAAPLSPIDLQRLWPEGPNIGGPRQQMTMR
jgi:hypothetical protein